MIIMIDRKMLNFDDDCLGGMFSVIVSKGSRNIVVIFVRWKWNLVWLLLCSVLLDVLCF